MALTVRFYGNRGSIMSVSHTRTYFGAHTPCITINDGANMLILDSGYAITILADELAQHKDFSQGGQCFKLLLTHFHWDHIQGLPFFSPIYFKGNKVEIFSPFPRAIIAEIMDHLFDGSYTPFNGIQSLPCEFEFIALEEETRIDGFDVSFKKVNHLGDTFAYRLCHPEGRVVYVTDHEAIQDGTQRALVEWASNVDLLIHDAMYTDEEYAQHQGWGHSSFSMAIRSSQQIGARKTIFTHFEPERTDQELKELQEFLNTNQPSILMARERLDYPVVG